MRGSCLRVFILLVLSVGAALADSSSPNLAAYYDRQMAIVAGKVYAWTDRNPPVRVPIEAVQVGVGRNKYYALTPAGELIAFGNTSGRRTMLMSGITRFAAGDSGVLAINRNGALWWLAGNGKHLIGRDAVAAAVGDGANYYITSSGQLLVKGLAHRGQYGDGRLKPTDQFVQTASQATYITAHTGHAILLLSNGDVLGTGGNIFGPVGKHGLGDKAVRWSKIASGAKAIATGSSHSLAILKDDTLVALGRGYDTDPVAILRDVVAVAAGSSTTIALKRDDTLLQWDRGRTPRQVSLPE